MSTRVLIVEDTENDALLMTRALQQADLSPEVMRVDTERDLISAMTEESWHVVLSDYSLPGFNALGALLLVRQLAPDVPFIVVSGAIGEDVAASLIKAGADDLVLKGNVSRLGSAVHRGLREAETRRAWRRAERELQEREARFRSIIENVNDVVLILDSSLSVRYQSPSLERVLGYSPDQFNGRPILDFVHPDDLEIARAALEGSNDSRESRFVPECRLIHRDGSWRVMEGLVTDLREDPAVHGIVTHARDITDRKRVEEERLRAQRLESIGSLAGGIAHDLNNLLTPILITTDMLSEDLTDEERQSLLDGVRVNAGRAADIVRQLLSFARGIKTDREAIRPAELLNLLERLLRFSLPKSIHLSIKPSEDLWEIAGDATQLLQVLMNLAVNARDAMPNGGSLTIEASNVILRKYDVRGNDAARPGRFVQIRVTDTGTGIPPAVRDRIFEPFFTTKEGESGTGLGLSTSMEIVRAHRGLINVYSEIGRGTRFTVSLPARDSDEKVSSLDELPKGSGERILVADDEASVRELIREALEAYGYRVDTAANGAEALACHAEANGDVQLAIVDVDMPLVDGPATVTSLRLADPQLPILVQGGFLQQHRDSFPPDINGFLEKPYRTSTLLRAVASALGRSTPVGEGSAERER